MEEIDLRELFKIFWSKKSTIILLMILFAIIGIIYSVGFVKPRYKSSTTLVLTKTDSTSQKASDSITANDITLNSKLVATYSELIKSNAVIREVITNLKDTGISENDLRKSVSVSAVKDTELIEITVSNAKPENAAKIANEIAEVFIKQVSEIYNINNVHVVDKAEVPENPFNINHKKNVIIFAAIGAVIAAGYILLDNMLDTTIRSSDEIEKKLALPILASIPLYNFDADRGGRD